MGVLRQGFSPPENKGALRCVVDGRLFIIGGQTASVEEYVASEQQWVSVPDMPRAVCDAAAVALDGNLLVIGGDDPDHELLSAVLEYNLGDHSWKELPSLLTARSFCKATVLGGDVVVVGGYGSNGYVRSVERYNRRLQCWEVMASLTIRLGDSAAVVLRV